MSRPRPPSPEPERRRPQPDRLRPLRVERVEPEVEREREQGEHEQIACDHARAERLDLPRHQHARVRPLVVEDEQVGEVLHPRLGDVHREVLAEPVVPLALQLLVVGDEVLADEEQRDRPEPERDRVARDALLPEPVDEERDQHRDRRDGGEDVVVELRRRERDEQEREPRPDERDRVQVVARRRVARTEPAEQDRRARDERDPGEDRVAALLDEVGEDPARGRRVDARAEPVEVVVDEEPVGERLPVLVDAGETG